MKRLFLSLILSSLFLPATTMAVTTELITDGTNDIPVKNTGDAFSANEFNSIIDLLRGWSRDDNNTFLDQTDDKVGINGIAAPSEALDVNGRVKATAYLGDGSLLTGINAGYWVQTGSDINYPTGNVGIGIATPAGTKLQVEGGTTDLVGRFRSTDNRAGLEISDDDTTTYISSENTVTSIGANLGVNAGNLNIDSDGNVGIGTAAPDAPLVIANLGGGVTGLRLQEGAVGSTGHDNSISARGMKLFYNNAATPRVDLGASAVGTSTGLAFSNEAWGSPEAQGAGIAMPAFRTLGLYTADGSALVERVRIDRDGNVGIGTTNPAQKLTVGGSILLDTASGSQSYIMGNRNGSAIGIIKWDDATDALTFGQGDGGFRFNASNSSEIVRILNNGNVGIGTVAPVRPLHVTSSLAGGSFLRIDNSAGSGSVGIEFDSSGTVQQAFSLDTSNNLVFRNTAGSHSGDIYFDFEDGVNFRAGAATNVLNILNSGRVGIGTTSPSSNLHIYDAGFSGTVTPLRSLVEAEVGVTSSNGYAIYKATGGSTSNAGSVRGLEVDLTGSAAVYDYGVYIDGEDRNYFSGNVGIGTAAPGYTLDVTGDVNFTGDLYQGGSLFSAGGKFVDGTPDPAEAVYMTGNVGVGIADPTYKLDVNDDAASGAGLRVTGGGSGQPIAVFQRDVGSTGSMVVSSSGGNPQFYLNRSSDTFAVGVDSEGFKISDNATVGTNDRLTIDSAGNVGIGTTAPATPLHVAQAADYVGMRVTGFDDESADYMDMHVGGVIGRISTNKSAMYFQVGGSYPLQVFPTEVRIADSLTINDEKFLRLGSNWDFRLGYDEATDDRLELTDSSGNRFLTAKDQGAAADLDFNAGDMFIRNDGNVGIGTTTPAQALHVKGSVEIGASDYTGQPIIYFQQDDNASAGWYVGSTGSAGNNLGIYGYESDGDFNIYTDGTQRLDISATGEVDINGNTALGSNAVVASDRVLNIDKHFSIDDANTYQLYSYTTHTSPALSQDSTSYGGYYHLINNKTENGAYDSDATGVRGYVRTTGANTYRSNYGGYFEARNESTASSGLGNLYGSYNLARHNSTAGNVGYTYGSYGAAIGKTGTAGSTTGSTSRSVGAYGTTLAYNTDVSDAYGVYGYALTNNSYDGDITNAYGVRGSVYDDSDDGGDITSAYGGYFTTARRSTSPDMAFAAGVYGDATGAVSNYGATLYADDSDATNNYGLYVSASNASGDNIGIYGAAGDWLLYDPAGQVGLRDTTPDLDLVLDVEGKIGADQYCNEDGGSCIAAEALGGGLWSLNGSDAQYSAGNALAGKGFYYRGQTPYPDHWSANGVGLGGDYGYIGTNGSFRSSWMWNGYRNDSGSWTSLGVNSYVSAGGIEIGNDGILFKSQSTTPTGTSPTTRMIVEPTGNVGIGTTDPAAKLQVTDTSNVSFPHHFRTTGRVMEHYGSTEVNPRTALGLGATGNGARDGLSFNVSSAVTVAAGGAGVDSPVARELALYTSNGTALTERLRVDGTGNVGIGIADPTYKLDVNDDGATGAGLRVTGGGGGQPLAVFQRDVGGTGSMVIHASGGDPQFYLNNSAASQIFAVGVDGSSFKISDNASVGTNDRLVISSTGNVGIGDSTPGNPLEINTTNRLGSTFTGTTSGEGLRVTQTDYVSGEYVSLVESAYDDGDASADVRIGAQFTGGGSTLSFGTSNSYGSGITNQALNIDPTGEVGIGIVTPAYDLDVAGDINFTGDLYDNGTLFAGGKFVDGTDTNDAVYTTGDVGIGTLVPRSSTSLHVASGTDSQGLTVDGTNPTLFLQETDTTDTNWQFRNAGGQLRIMAQNDAGSAGVSRITVNQDGAVDIINRVAVGANATPATTQTLQVEDNPAEDATTYQIHSNVAATSPALTADRTSYGAAFTLYNNKTESGTNDSDATGVYGTTITNGTNTFRTNRGVYGYARNDSTASSGLGNIYGVDGYAYQNASSGTVPTAYGVFGHTIGDTTAGSTSAITTGAGVYGTMLAYESNITNAYGTYGLVQTVNGDQGNITNAYGARGYISHDSDDGATMTNAYGGYFTTRKRTGASNIGTATGVYTNVDGATTAYGGQFHVNDSVATNNYGLYVDASNASGNNYALYLLNGDIAFNNSSTIRTITGEMACAAGEVMTGFDTGGIKCRDVQDVIAESDIVYQ